MKKSLILAGLVLVVGVGAYLVIDSAGKSDSEVAASQQCVEACGRAKTVCPSLLSSGNCEASCKNWSEEVIEKIGAANSCEVLGNIPELVSALIPEMNTPEQKTPSNDCESACGNYVGKCLALVPNASQSLFSEGLTSCQKECKGWSAPKVACMIGAVDCESMTDVCGL